MTRTKIAVAAALLSAAALMPTMAQAQFSEPAAYQAAHPDRDVLNGGQLTPAARSGPWRDSGTERGLCGLSVRSDAGRSPPPSPPAPKKA